MDLLIPILRKLQLSILHNCRNFRVLTLSSPVSENQVYAVATGLLPINPGYICIGYSSLCCKPPPTHLGLPDAAESLQSCPSLCDPIDGSPPSLGFSRQEHWSGGPLPSLWDSLLVPIPDLFPKQMQTLS